MLPATAVRVVEHTPESAAEAIRRRTRDDLVRIAAEGPHAIDARLAELDREWDIERVLQTNFSIVVMASLALGAIVHRRFFALGALAAGFMAEHALQGWCPPLSVFRRLGVRTAAEIDEERYALKALRGDFRGLASISPAPEDAARALAAVDR